MKTVQSGELKNNFAHFLEKVIKGEIFVVSYGRKKKKVAVLGPYDPGKRTKRKLGILEGKISIKMNEDWEINDAEFLNS